MKNELVYGRYYPRICIRKTTRKLSLNNECPIAEGSLPCSQNSTLVPNLRQMNLVKILTTYFSKILFNIIFPSTARPYRSKVIQG
jgi:hypothetical protein